MRLNALCEESSHWETGPNGMILASGIGEIGARRAFEAMCYFDSLMRPRWLEMLHRNCRQSSPPAQNPRPASRFRLDKRDERCGPAPHAAERGGSLQRLPAPKATGEARHDLLLANPPQPRLHHLRRVGRFGPVTAPSMGPYSPVGKNALGWLSTCSSQRLSKIW